jgi:predicted TIM-barrel fold metal-dependent hydrolase
LQLDLGELLIEFFATPGHSRDSISLYLPKYRLLFASDTVVTCIVPPISLGDGRELEQSLALFKQLDIKILIPGHGDVIFGREEIRQWLSKLIRYLQNVRRKVKEQLKIMLEHMGKPPIASGRIRPWADDLAAVATNPSVFCKISELVSQAHWNNWSSEDLKPYVQHALRCFGAKRLMWGSGWPVCLLAADFESTLTSTREALGPLSASELELIFNKTARSFYDLGP